MNHVEMEADLLCIGGGIAGLMAAIRASELGLKVIVAEKSNTLYSGCGGLGNDHFLCYIPEVHGTDLKAFIQTAQQSVTSGMRHRDWLEVWLENTHDIVRLWDTWGIPMRHHGEYDFAGHAVPGRPKIHLHYGGRYQKKVLTKEARKRGVEIVNRVMVFDLLVRDGAILGALGFDSKEDRLIVFKSKCVVVASGRCSRLYPPPVPGWMFNVAHSPACTGDGMAMSFRAGAGLGNMELCSRWAGPRYLARCGKASWIGVLRDPLERPIGPFVTKPEKKYGDAISDIYPTLFADYAEEAKGPVYMDCRGISEEDYQYMMEFMRHEGLSSLLDYLETEGIDLRRNPVEFGTYEIQSRGGIYHDEKGESSIGGLFAAGDNSYSSSSVSMAATFGWLTGEHAAAYAKQAPEPELKEAEGFIGEKRAFLQSVRARKDGPDWKEVNVALQQIMQDYAGVKRTSHLLEAGMRYLLRLKEKTAQSLTARNAHELMRCLEVLNMVDLGEALFIGARERKESRGNHKRPDYPFTNPMLEKFLVIRRGEGNPVAEFIEVRR